MRTFRTTELEIRIPVGRNHGPHVEQEGLKAKMNNRAQQGLASGIGPPGEPEAEQLASAPEGRPVSWEDPVLWLSYFGTGKAEASMRTSPSSQGPNTPGCALWQDLAGSKGVRPGIPWEGRRAQGS